MLPLQVILKKIDEYESIVVIKDRQKIFIDDIITIEEQVFGIMFDG